MLRIITAVFLALGAGHASAQACPDFFRFVDFGLQDPEGRFLRGGPLYRAESLTGRTLLLMDETECRDVSDIARDGHGNPVPVVTRAVYDVEKSDVDVNHLSVVFSDDTRAAAASNSQVHRKRLGSANATQIKTDRSLCAKTKHQRDISCQVVPPYPGNIDLVVYCKATLCNMPVLAVSETIQISAKWEVATPFWNASDTAGDAILDKIDAIVAFFAPLSSGI